MYNPLIEVGVALWRAEGSHVDHLAIRQAHQGIGLGAQAEAPMVLASELDQFRVQEPSVGEQHDTLSFGQDQQCLAQRSNPL